MSFQCSASQIGYLLLFVALASGAAKGQEAFQGEPINYDSSTPTDRVTRLANQLESGDAQLTWDSQHGCPRC